MRRFAPLLTVVALVAVPGSLYAQPKAKKLAVLVGVNGYANRPFEDLKYASGRDLALAKVEDGWPKLEPRACCR